MSSLTKQTIPINFSQGLDLKSDPFQIPIGKFFALQNSIFTKNGRLTKRNGFGQITSLPNNTSSFLTTFNGNLTAIGSSLLAYSQGQMTWVNKGTLQPLSLSTLSLIRSGTNQSQADVAVSANGLVCTVYTDNIPSSNVNVFTYKYAVADATTGQNIVAPTIIVPSSGSVTFAPKVFLLGNHFVIVFSTFIGGAYHLQYLSVSTVNPTLSTAAVDISTSYGAASTGTFNGVVAAGNLYLAYNLVTSGGVQVTYLDSNLNAHNKVTFAAHVATHITVTADTTQSSLVVWVVSYNSGDSTGYAIALSQTLGTVLAQTQVISSGTILNLAVSAQNSLATIFYEISNAYSYDATVQSNYVNSVTITQAGTVGTPATVIRSVGLASNSFIIGGVIYFACAYSSTLQPTYFVADSSGNVIAKLAYSNGGGYSVVGVPNPTVSGKTVYFPYLIKDAVESAAGVGVYAQTGVNLATIILGTNNIFTSEIGNNLHLGGGFTWVYDGYTPVEHFFHVWPDSIEATWTTTSTVTPTGTFANASTTVTVSSGTGIYAGMTITDTSNAAYIPAGTTVVSISGTTVIISKATTHAGTTDNLSIQGNIAAKPDTATNTNAYAYQVTYEWTDNQGNIERSSPSIPIFVTTVGAGSAGIITVNVPMLRLTYKTKNPVNIVIYRWSVQNQAYYQVTSVAVPQLNVTTSDSLSFVDTLPDASVIGNNLIYTTGGVVPNVAFPAVNALNLFDTRLWGISAENPNVLVTTKQVIQNTAAEPNDAFNMYVAPSTAAQGNTGPMLCIAPLDDKQIIFKRSAIYYFNGVGPDNTNANNQYSQPIFITGTVGCANQNSIVVIPHGMMFQSDKGIWLLGRDLSTTYIGAPVESYNSFNVQSAINVPGTNQVRFTLSNGVTLMYDYFFNQWGTFNGVPAVSSIIYQNQHTFINALGQVYQETPNVYLDGSLPVLMSFTTGWINAAGLQGYQRAYRMFILGQYLSPISLTCGVSYDYDPYATQQPQIFPNDNVTPPWGGLPQWGSPPAWGGVTKRLQWQVNFQRQQCQAFQITISENYNSALGAAGAGLTLSGIDLVCGLKKAYPKNISAANKIG